MKVLSIREPFASLIKEQKKMIETRSWSTSYRGELYIHASLGKVKKEKVELINLLTNQELNYGYIICKCKLIDCIYMTSEYVNKIKNSKHQEYICGEYKEGRYAWVLSDIKPINPIKAHGQLGIWNYYNDLEIMDLMSNIEYGWLDLNGNKNIDTYNSFASKYILQSPQEVMKNKIGVCWDQVELERYYFKKNTWSIKTYFIIYYDGDKCPTHTFLTYKKDNKYYWFEHSWEKFKGIHEYNFQEELLQDVKNKYIKYELNNNYIEENIVIYQYMKPQYNISARQFIAHCESGEKININPK